MIAWNFGPRFSSLDFFRVWIFETIAFLLVLMAVSPYILQPTHCVQ